MARVVNVASKLDHAVLMQGFAGDTGIEREYTIVGTRDPGAVGGFGLTYGVDAVTFELWLAGNPQMQPFVAVATDEQIAEYEDPLNTYGYEIGIEPPEPPPTAPPVNVDVPYVQQGKAAWRDALFSTMGNWENMDTGVHSYSYQWQIDGADAGANSSTYFITNGVDDGKTGVCIVTATNELGSTAASPSNPVVIVSPAGSGRAAPGSVEGLMSSVGYHDGNPLARMTQGLLISS